MVTTIHTCPHSFCPHTLIPSIPRHTLLTRWCLFLKVSLMVSLRPLLLWLHPQPLHGIFYCLRHGFQMNSKIFALFVLKFSTSFVGGITVVVVVTYSVTNVQITLYCWSALATPSPSVSATGALCCTSNRCSASTWHPVQPALLLLLRTVPQISLFTLASAQHISLTLHLYTLLLFHSSDCSTSWSPSTWPTTYCWPFWDILTIYIYIYFSFPIHNVLTFRAKHFASIYLSVN